METQTPITATASENENYSVTTESEMNTMKHTVSLGDREYHYYHDVVEITTTIEELKASPLCSLQDWETYKDDIHMVKDDQRSGVYWTWGWGLERIGERGEGNYRIYRIAYVAGSERYIERDELILRGVTLPAAKMVLKQLAIAHQWESGFQVLLTDDTDTETTITVTANGEQGESEYWGDEEYPNVMWQRAGNEYSLVQQGDYQHRIWVMGDDDQYHTFKGQEHVGTFSLLEEALAAGERAMLAVTVTANGDQNVTSVDVEYPYTYYQPSELGGMWVYAQVNDDSSIIIGKAPNQDDAEVMAFDWLCANTMTEEEECRRLWLSVNWAPTQSGTETTVTATYSGDGHGSTNDEIPSTKNNLWGNFDPWGGFSWFLEGDEYVAHSTSLYHLLSRQDGETEEDWHERWVKEVDRLSS